MFSNKSVLLSMAAELLQCAKSHENRGITFHLLRLQSNVVFVSNLPNLPVSGPKPLRKRVAIASILSERESMSLLTEDPKH